MRRTLTGLVLLMLAGALLPGWAAAPSSAWAAERRAALVIGNSAYLHVPALANAANDATAMAASLERIGFSVTKVIDADLGAMRAALLSFSRDARGADVALLFYAGHGVQVEGKNHLLPVSAEIESKYDLPFVSVALDQVLNMMQDGGARVRIAMVDACRNNPLADGTRSLASGRGLAPVETNAAGTLIAFAAAPGAVAQDGDGRNSPFTTALLQHLETPGIEIRSMLGRVRQDVLEATAEGQLPWVNEAIVGDFFLVPKAAEAPAGQAAAPQPAPGDGAETERLFWSSVMSSDDPRMYREYLNRFPDGAFRSLAEIKLAALTAREAVEPEPAPEPEPEPTPPARAEVQVAALDLAWVAATTANLRAGPSVETEIVGRVVAGQDVTVTGKVEGANWYRLALAGGRTAYIHGDLIADPATLPPPKPPAPEPAPPAPVVQPAPQPRPEPAPPPVQPAPRDPSEQLAAALIDPDPAVRRAAVDRALAGLTVPSARLLMGRGDAATQRRAFAAAWRSPDPGVRKAAMGFLNGTWRGQYSYSKGTVPFELQANVDPGGRLSGRSTEPNTFGDSSSAQLYALFNGSIAPSGSVRLRKTYDGTAGVSHSVDYVGRFNPDTLEIRGQWNLPGSNGTFVLTRG